jgi:SAM-dependent methyltransferase
MADDPYAADAEFYDAIHAGLDDDAWLWASFAGRSDRPVLDVGTGSGRIALALAREGFRVTGVDPSAAMLARARAAAEREGLRVEWLEGRPPGVAVQREAYGLVLLANDVFLYCEDRDAQVACLRWCAAALHFNGALIIDVPGPAMALDPSSNGQPLVAWSGELPDGRWLTAWHVSEDDLAEQVRELTVLYDVTGPDGVLRRSHGQHRLRYVYRFEMELLLEAAGLEVEDVCGDYGLGPLTGESERMIVVARRSDR